VTRLSPLTRLPRAPKPTTFAMATAAVNPIMVRPKPATSRGLIRSRRGSAGGAREASASLMAASGTAAASPGGSSTTHRSPTR
jgi:hypothetical protein